MKRLLTLYTLALMALFTSCEKNLYLPPDWNYEIPETSIKGDIQLGAFYNNYTTSEWKSEHYKPVLNIEYDDAGEIVSEAPYLSASDGILTRQCEWAAEAGIDFFIFSNDQALLDIFDYYYERDGLNMKIAVKFSLPGSIASLTDSGEGFDAAVAAFKTLYANVISKPWYYHLPDGRPLIIMSGMEKEGYDYSLFIPALRTALEEEMNPYIVGENTSNWCAPQVNQNTAKYLDANYNGKWYPSNYYERWSCFYPFTDMAWSNWREYAAGWKNDYIPCIYPEYYVTEKGARSIDRTEKNYTDFCNVAKRNLGSQNIVFINSWNDFSTESALEPTAEYGKKYMEITYNQFKRK